MRACMDTRKLMPLARLVWQVAAQHCGFVLTLRFRPVRTAAHRDKKKYTKNLLCTRTQCIAEPSLDNTHNGFLSTYVIMSVILKMVHATTQTPHNNYWNKFHTRSTDILTWLQSLPHTDTHACMQWSNSWSVSHECHWWLVGLKSQRADVSRSSNWKISRADIHTDTVWINAWLCVTFFVCQLEKIAVRYYRRHRLAEKPENIHLQTGLCFSTT